MEALMTLTLSNGDEQVAIGAQGAGRGKTEKTEVAGEMELNGRSRYLWTCTYNQNTKSMTGRPLS